MQPLKYFLWSIILFFGVTIRESIGNFNKATVKHRLVSGNTKIISNNIHKHDELQCGKWLKSFSDVISYKIDKPVGNNERCVWIIAVPSAIGYKINVTFLDDFVNQPDGDQELVFTGIQSKDGEQPLLTNYKPIKTGNFTISKAQVVIVTFHSRDIEETWNNGFGFKYEAIYGNSHVSALSTHHVFPSLTFEFKYPEDRNTYDKYELATFVFPPVRNVYNCGASFLWYKSYGLDPDYDCKDSLFIYNFKISVEGVGYYEYAERLCHGNATWIGEFDDIVVLIFQTNGSRQFSGFSFSYVGC